MIITNSPVIIFLICNIIKCFKLQTAKQCHFFFFLEMVLIPVSLSPSVTNLRPQFIRHSVYQIQSLKSIFHFHCVIIRDLIQVITEWSSGLPYLLFENSLPNCVKPGQLLLYHIAYVYLVCYIWHTSRLAWKELWFNLTPFHPQAIIPQGQTRHSIHKTPF